MAGLLDIYDDPNQAGLLGLATGLLSASGPSRTPVSLGQALAVGMQGMQANRKSALDQQREAMQMDMLKQQIAAATRTNEMKNMWLGKLSELDSAPSQALAEGAANGSIGPTVANADRLSQIQKSNPLFGVPRQAIAADIAMNDGKHIGEWIFKQGTPDMQVSNGYAYDKNSVKPGFMPQLSMSQDGKSSLTTIGADGLPVVSAPRGALETFGAYQNAAKAAETANELVTVDLPGGPRQMTKRQALEMTNPGRAAAGWNGINASVRAEQPQRDNDRLAILQQEMATERDPANRAALQREIDRMGGQGAGMPGVQLANKERTAVTNDLAKTRLSTLEKDAQSQQDILSKLNIAERLINEGTYGNDFKGRLGMMGQNSGAYPTPQGVNTNLLTQIGNQLVLARGSLGAGVSTADADRYDRAAGDFTNAQSNEQRRKAISVMREIADTAFKNANAARQQYAETGTLPDFSAPAPSNVKTYKDFGYNSAQDAIRDAKNALLRFPGQKAEIVRRLEAAGITQHGIK